MNSHCFHCGLAVPNGANFPILFQGAEHPGCCAGCQAVAHTIIDSGLGNYYLHRTAKAKQALSLPDTLLEQLKLYDAEELQHSFVHIETQQVREATLLIEDISCAACVWLIERHVRRLAGIVSVSIHYGNHRARIRWDTGQLALSSILEAIHALGYRALPYSAARQELAHQQQRKRMLGRLWVAGLSMMQVMMYAIPVYLADEGEIETRFLWLMHWASLLLTLPVVFYSSLPFYQGSWREIKQRQLGMNTPITLGIVSTFVASSWALFQHIGHAVYFDSISMFVFLLLGGRYLENLAQHKASEATDKLVKLLPAFAHHMPNWPENRLTCELPIHRIVIGDTLLVKPGETIPCDGVVQDGQSDVNEAWLTGESRPIKKTTADKVIAGSTNLESPLVIEVKQTGQNTRLAHIVRLLDKALAHKPRQLLLADQVASYFVTILLIIACICYGVWLHFSSYDQALWVTVAVLVVSCPCALSLATPTAVTAASGHLAKLGVLITRGQALETLANVTDVIFDKTGTLTTGKFTLTGIIPLTQRDNSFGQAIAHALEIGSEHPLARALTAAIGTVAPIPASNVQNYPGQGVSGWITGKIWRIGRLEFVAEIAGNLPQQSIDTTAETLVGLGSDQGWEMIFSFSDSVNANTKKMIDQLRDFGISTHIVSGDRENSVKQLSEVLAIDHSYAQASPEDKLNYVSKLQAQGRCVLMIGDGINDAPVLAKSNVSIAMGSGTDLAQTTGDMILVNDRLDTLPQVIQLARKTALIIRQNLWWAIVYNICALPLALSGSLTPALASIGMASSSLLVVANALRLTQ